jgi:hypothetical protein
MKSAIKLISLGTIVTGGVVAGFNLSYIKNTDLSESKVPPFPV